MRKCVALALACAVSVVGCGCGGHAGARQTAPPRPVTASALDGLLLSAAEMNSIMGTDALIAGPVSTAMADDRDRLPNLNCLGIWQVAEKAIYSDSDWTALRAQRLRQPDTDDWDALVVQAVVSFPSADAARAFLTDSSDRWSKCTNHRVNMTRNDRRVTWSFGALTRTDTELTMVIDRDGGARACQRALSAVSNVIIDVAGCAHNPGTQAAASIVDKITTKLPR